MRTAVSMHINVTKQQAKSLHSFLTGAMDAGAETLSQDEIAALEELTNKLRKVAFPEKKR